MINLYLESSCAELIQGSSCVGWLVLVARKRSILYNATSTRMNHVLTRRHRSTEWIIVQQGSYCDDQFRNWQIGKKSECNSQLRCHSSQFRRIDISVRQAFECVKQRIDRKEQWGYATKSCPNQWLYKLTCRDRFSLWRRFCFGNQQDQCGTLVLDCLIVERTQVMPLSMESESVDNRHQRQMENDTFNCLG